MQRDRGMVMQSVAMIRSRRERRFQPHGLMSLFIGQGAGTDAVAYPEPAGHSHGAVAGSAGAEARA